MIIDNHSSNYGGKPQASILYCLQVKERLFIIVAYPAWAIIRMNFSYLLSDLLPALAHMLCLTDILVL